MAKLSTAVIVCAVALGCGGDDTHGVDTEPTQEVTGDGSGDGAGGEGSGSDTSTPGQPSGTDGQSTTPDPGQQDTVTSPTSGHDCQDPDTAWLFCEDFEAGDGDWDSWFAASDFIDGSGLDDRGRLVLDDEHTHSGDWAMKLPADPASGHQGGSLFWYACDGEMRTNCSLRSYDTLYFRTWMRLAEDHRYVHHFLTIAGSQPDDFWYHGTAGCHPNGELDMHTIVDFAEDSHETFFYSYHMDMSCDPNCGNYSDVAAICDECASKGLPTCSQQQQCCWGDNLYPETPAPLPLGQWVCMEIMMQANTPGEHDGVMRYWIDDELGHEMEGMMWRTSPTLALNRVQLHHYITSSDAGGHSNVITFDDVVVSTERIGCH